jgi:hypothetical protein
MNASISESLQGPLFEFSAGTYVSFFSAIATRLGLLLISNSWQGRLFELKLFSLGWAHVCAEMLWGNFCPHFTGQNNVHTYVIYMR